MIFYPRMKEKAPLRQRLEVFKGYDRNLRIGSGSFCQMENLTSDDFPVLSPRGKRAEVVDIQEGSCIGMHYVPEIGLFYAVSTQNRDDERTALRLLKPSGEDVAAVDAMSPEPKRFATMGVYLIIVPDMKWVRMDDLTHGDMAENLVISTGNVIATLCLADGTLLDKGHRGPNAPEDPQSYSHWVDSSVYPSVVKRYSEAQQEWVTMENAYVCLSGPGLGNNRFQEGDGIHLTGFGEYNGASANKMAHELNGCHTVLQQPSSYSLVINGVMEGKYTHICENAPVHIERRVPKMDFILECGNRLWGCARGSNEIYACKLGDFKNWYCFQGLSTDSWAGSIGTPGEFTGAVVQNGYPIFYKENCKHKVWPSATGAHQITALTCEGVKKGCENSLAVWEGTVFYRSTAGVRADEGGGPVDIGQALGAWDCESAAGCVFQQKYYLAVKDKEGRYELLVYDLGKRLWHREDGHFIRHFAAGGGSLYADLRGNVWDLTGKTGTPEEQVSWMGVTGDLGLELPEQKYISRLTLRLCLEPGATLEVYAQYDRDPAWVKLGQVYGTNLRSFSLPVRPRRCDQLRLKLQGTGMCKLYSITKTLEKGSELP